MARAEFEEKSYEIAAAIELGAIGSVFSPGQVLEGELAFDAAAAPRDALLWRLLSVPRPKGVLLAPSLWDFGPRRPGHALPSWPVSLILQYKRPEYLYGPAAAQWRLWSQPYFRFRRTAHQQTILRRLERRMAGAAVVRYAAPAFWRWSELEAAHLGRNVLAQSGFVSPRRVGAHKVWTYAEPGTNGRGNPDGPPRPFESLEEFLGSVFEPPRDPVEEAALVRQPESLRAHVARLGAAAREREPRLRARIAQWRNNVRRADIGIEEPDLDLAADFASVTTLLAGIGAVWQVADREPPF